MSKFKVGDKVQFAWYGNWNDECDGNVYTITDITDGIFGGSYKLECDEHTRSGVYEDEIRLV